jgi:serine/threonine protein kinase
MSEQFGPYRLEFLLGRGGMGEVFRAFDTEHERIVALKRLAPHLADDPQFRTRFKQEARLAARLRNPHIIAIHRFGELDGHLFIDMRFVDGFDASDLVQAVGPLSPGRAVSLVEQVASALDTAHAAGLVHRDVKPSNLLIDREISHQVGDFVYLADFGITRSSSALRSYSLTRTGALLGSLDYMAPEQFDGMADKRVDIYALTCVLFELLTGQRPYQASGLPALMHAHLNVAPPAPSQVRPNLGTRFDDVVRRGMAKRREERYEGAGELAAAARRALSISERAGHHGPEVGLDHRASRNFREAEYAYIAQSKKREHMELRGRHVLNEDGSQADVHAAPTVFAPPSRTGGPPTESAVNAPGSVDDAETETTPVAVPESGNGARAPNAAKIGAFPDTDLPAAPMSAPGPTMARLLRPARPVRATAGHVVGPWPRSSRSSACSSR